MQVVLLTDVRGVGKKGEVKSISDGYARNFLFPRKMAAPADSNQGKQVAAHEAGKAQSKQQQQEALAAEIQKLDGKTVSMSAKANDKGHLFKGINPVDIASELGTQLNMDISADVISPQDPIKETGEHARTIASSEAQATVTISVGSA